MSNATNKDKLCVVQFMHGGGEFPVFKCKNTVAPEQRADGSFLVHWSEEDEHYRRLVTHTGNYVDGQGNYYSGQLAFWTEWEATTIARQIGLANDFFKAQFTHVVQNPGPVMGTGFCQGGEANTVSSFLNTDPCVFGDNFKYSNCHQTINGSLRRMRPGSLVVFGSYKRDKLRQREVFCLDTVFVVSEGASDYSTTDGIGSVPCTDEYRNLTLRRLPSGHNYTFYRGVRCNGAVKMQDVLFSFTPARLYELGHSPYERCILADVELLNAHLDKAVFKRGRKINFHSEVASSQQVKAVWDAIVKEVLNQGYVLGVHFDWPVDSKIKGESKRGKVLLSGQDC